MYGQLNALCTLKTVPTTYQLVIIVHYFMRKYELS